MIREIGGMAPSKGLAWALSRLPYAYRPPTQETNKIEPIGKPLKSLVPRKRHIHGHPQTEQLGNFGFFTIVRRAA
jgi:hypothetical protein